MDGAPSIHHAAVLAEVTVYLRVCLQNTEASTIISRYGLHSHKTTTQGFTPRITAYTHFAMFLFREICNSERGCAHFCQASSLIIQNAFSCTAQGNSQGLRTAKESMLTPPDLVCSGIEEPTDDESRFAKCSPSYWLQFCVRFHFSVVVLTKSQG